MHFDGIVALIYAFLDCYLLKIAATFDIAGTDQFSYQSILVIVL